ncbi:MAG: hypothetical protein JO122_13150, partial [Acetobacteraceae bacterium]|nr:hypothetical protein [Acetobacteraceae bacterium]
MDELITPDELSRHAPGELTMDSAPFGWEGVRLRGYRYAPSDVQGPGMRDYLIVVCTDGVALTNRNCGNGWRTEQFAPGNVSLLTRAVQSHWRWNEEIEVTHLYLSPGAVANIAAQVYDRDAQEIELRDVLRADDSVLSGIITCLTGELRQGGVGGRLYVESLKTQACLHVLRHYANVVFREPSNSGGLSRTQHRLVEQFIDEHLEQDISLADLAGVVQLSTL